VNLKAGIATTLAAGKVPKPDFAVYVEPTRLNIYAAQMRFVICEISRIGRSAYFGVPELGLDALAVLSAVWAHFGLSRFDDFGLRAKVLNNVL
jgi:acetylornithine deacetylase